MADPLAVVREARFGVQYEPLVDVWSGRLHGYEALARFHRPDGVGVPPAVVFGRLALDPDLLWRTELALKRLQIAHAPGPRLFLNLSAEAWASPGREAFLAVLRAARVPLVVEVVESVHAQGVRKCRELVRTLVAEGIPAALDDLGGRDVLVSTEDLRAASVLKLDRSVMRAIEEPGILALAESLVAFAQRTGKLVVAEGVETARDLAAARALGVSLAQGDLFRDAMLRLSPEHCPVPYA